MLVADLVAAMESIAPPRLAEEWDNIGLLVGDAARPLAGPVLLTIDLTDAVLDEAVAMKAGAIVAYHPPIFAPMKRLTADTAAGRRLLRLVEAGIALYSPHTALDAAEGGVADWLIDLATNPTEPDAQAREGPLPPTEPDAQAREGSLPHGRGSVERAALVASPGVDPNQTHKIVTFVPVEALEKVRAALADAGAGRIGNYEVCSFTVRGTGTFRGGEGANPVVGKKGQLESVEEVRLEMVCGGALLHAVIAALRASHPYEEPAFDVYALAPRPSRKTGPGRIVALDQPVSVEEIAERLKNRLRVPGVGVAFLPSRDREGAEERRHASGALPDGRGSDRKGALPDGRGSDHMGAVRRVAAVPGSGASGGLLDAALAGGAECFITGEMKHHDVLAALDRGCAVILAGHTETERGYLPVLARRLNESDTAFGAVVSQSDRSPLVRA